MTEVNIDQLMNMCRANVFAAFVLDEDMYMTKLLSDNLTKEELVWIYAQEEVGEEMCSIITKLLVERMQDATSWCSLVTIDDAEKLSSQLFDALSQTKDVQYHAFITEVIYRYITLFTNYCALIHDSQRVALTKLTMVTSIYAIANRMSVDEAISSPVVRAQVIARLVKRDAWWEATTSTHKELDWQTIDEGVRASVQATIERRSREIWGR